MHRFSYFVSFNQARYKYLHTCRLNIKNVNYLFCKDNSLYSQNLRITIKSFHFTSSYNCRHALDHPSYTKSVQLYRKKHRHTIIQSHTKYPAYTNTICTPTCLNYPWSVTRLAVASIRRRVDTKVMGRARALSQAVRACCACVLC
jgi:hypothetical protein